MSPNGGEFRMVMNPMLQNIFSKNLPKQILNSLVGKYILYIECLY